ncbi:MAG TPA: 2-dehydro-3-deoxyphosphogluconate aldolase [Verrucomicrobia bacterium]|nr:2-dehydro-3-deoxyphosphogluconate aldolase [Verrucomicrobiota bacterium]
MTKQDIIARIKASRVVAVLTLDAAEDAIPLADALLAGGIKVIELTLRTPASEEGLRRIAAARPQMLIGAGTVLTAAQLGKAINAGAMFAVSPGLNHAVSAEAESRGFSYFPGVPTPTDVEAALAMGHRLMKFFPASIAGGIPMLKALDAPYGQAGVQFLPLGGVNAENAADYLALPCVAAVGGSWIAERSLIKEKRFDEIQRRAAACASL